MIVYGIINIHYVKRHFRPLRFHQLCNFHPKVCFPTYGSKRFEILPLSSGPLTPSIFSVKSGGISVFSINLKGNSVFFTLCTNIPLT
ncbi:hypothetical protein Hanom_Chr17g01555231 [Helianthus anomalus]